jgi:SNF2 family DNA or RNA helicase
VVERFQTGSQVPVFLISLKAGGVGLNLTGADTVIHFDPWWNPAVEAQATDRAHRIGQKKVVTSYKLITRGTIEEKILNLQTRKRALTQELLGGEEQLVAALDWNEIQDLLAG